MEQGVKSGGHRHPRVTGQRDQSGEHAERGFCRWLMMGHVPVGTAAFVLDGGISFLDGLKAEGIALRRCGLQGLEPCRADDSIAGVRRDIENEEWIHSRGQMEWPKSRSG